MKKEVNAAIVVALAMASIAVTACSLIIKVKGNAETIVESNTDTETVYDTNTELDDNKTVETDTEANRNTGLRQLGNPDIYEFVDPDTGVHYLVYSHTSVSGGTGGMTPRLNADGSTMVTK